MTYLYNDPTRFADELVEGFVAANATWVTAVPGGVIRSTETPQGQVAVVVGGGSGHYPAFAGLVGPGLAHGAAMGNLFASPSAQQIYTVAKAAHAGGGVLFTYGNYAGDVLNFDQAQDRLRAEGIDCRTVVVTDDISSAPPAERAKRRGIAGDLVVFKAAGAAAEQGLTLDEVERIAASANDRTRSFGVAFSGCTLPGATEPLFTVPEGRMAVGMGIHGEPGIDEVDVPSADDLARLLVSSLLAEMPEPDSRRVAVILNGLGAVKYEELFVLYRTVARLLAEAGLEVVQPEVGELVTSFQMAGTSLTLAWLDDELESAWRAPADTPAYRKGAAPARPLRSSATIAESVADTLPDATEDSKAAVPVVLAALEAAAEAVDGAVEELGRIDAVAGDGDHGIGMQRGVTAALTSARAAAERGAGSGTVLNSAADAWADRAGGTSGALWGIILRSVGAAIGDSDAPNRHTVAAGVSSAAAEVGRFGKAQRGDKTMLDTLIPFSEALDAEVARQQNLLAAWAAAATVAEREAQATADLLPRMGRARPHAEKSLGTPDAGAISMALIIRAIERVLALKGTKS
jgi:dihydroxyacetone kinase